MILLDLKLPGMSGTEVVAEHRRRNGARVPIVLVTASPDSILKGVSGDVYGVVRKPFEADDLVAVIRKVVAR